MSIAVDSVAVAVSPSKHCTPNRSLRTYEHKDKVQLLGQFASSGKEADG